MAEDVAPLGCVGFRIHRSDRAIGGPGALVGDLFPASGRNVCLDPLRCYVVDGAREQVGGHDGEGRRGEDGKRAPPEGGERLGDDAGFGGHGWGSYHAAATTGPVSSAR
jgi:hypothetical protein